MLIFQFCLDSGAEEGGGGPQEGEGGQLLRVGIVGEGLSVSVCISLRVQCVSLIYPSRCTHKCGFVCTC